MTRRLGRWRETSTAPLRAVPPLDELLGLAAAGQGSEARRRLAPYLDELPVAHARLALSLEIGSGGRGAGHRVALLLAAHPGLLRAVPGPALRGLVPAQTWPETAAGLRLGLELGGVTDAAHAASLAALLHALPRSPGELDDLRERSARLGGLRHGHALLDGLAASGLWEEGWRAACALARGERRADPRVGYLDRAARLAEQAGDPVQAGVLGARALQLAPAPGRALAMLGRPPDGSLEGVLDDLYDELEPVVAECQVVLELATGQLDLALDRAEAADVAALGAVGDPLRWVLAATLAWAAPDRAQSPLLEQWLERCCGVEHGLLSPTSPEGPRLVGGVLGALVRHQAARPRLRVEAEWSRGAALGLAVRVIDGAARDHARYDEAATLVSAWLERGPEGADAGGSRSVVRELAARHPRHRALRRALVATSGPQTPE